MGNLNNKPIKAQSWFIRSPAGRVIAWVWWTSVLLLKWSIFLVAVVTSIYFGCKEWLGHQTTPTFLTGLFAKFDAFVKNYVNFDLDHSKFIDVFIGSCGVLIGVIVTLLVERKNRGDSEYIRSTTDEILAQVEGAVTFSTITEYEKLLDAIDEVIEDANKRHHDLFIINPTASFGFFMTFDADVVVSSTHDEAQRHTSPILKLRRGYLARNTAQRFYGDQQQLLLRKEKNFDAILRMAETSSVRGLAKIHYATLSGSGGTLNSPYHTEFADPGTKAVEETDKIVVKWYQSIADDSKKMGRAIGREYRDATKLFLIHPESFRNVLGEAGSHQSQDARTDFVKLLEQDQRRRIALMREKHRKIDVKALRSVPLQLFLSWPSESIIKRHSKRNAEFYDKCMCLVIFSNKYTIGKTENIAAFRTQKFDVARVFREMWDVIVRRELDDSDPANVKLPPNPTPGSRRKVDEGTKRSESRSAAIMSTLITK
jgi:hypothetical protein